MLPHTTLSLPPILLLLALSPLTLSQTTTPSPHPHAHALPSALSALALADASTLSSLRSSLLANPTYASVSAFLATQTLVPSHSLAREEEAYFRAIATGATDAESPFITQLPSGYRAYVQGVVSAVVAVEEGEYVKGEGVGREVKTMVEGGGYGYGGGYGGGYGSGVVTGTATGVGPAATGTGVTGSTANGTMTRVTTGSTTAPATSPPASQPSGSGAPGMRGLGVGAWCAGILGVGVGVMMLM